MRMSFIERNQKEEEGRAEGSYPVWLCVALEIPIEGYPLPQKVARTFIPSCTKLSNFRTLRQS